MKNLKYIYLTLLLVPFLSLANNSGFTQLEGWASNGNAIYASKDSGQILYFAVNHSKDGSQRLYIEYAIVNDEEELVSTCSVESDSETVVITINGQPVKFISFCSESGSDSWYQSMTAQSAAGRDFVINAFKTSKTVSISTPAYKLEVSAKGFTKVWDNTGGDAL